MTLEREYNGTTIIFSSNIELIRKCSEDNEPCVLLINNENRFEDVSFAKYAIEIETFDPMAYDDEGEFSSNEDSESSENLLSEEEVLNLATDEYCRMLIARTYGEPVDIVTTDRLIIRELSTKDVIPLMNLYNNVKPTFLERFFDDREEATEYISSYIDRVYGFYNFGIWGVYSKEDENLIGLVGFTPRVAREKDSEELVYNVSMDLEMGYAIDENHRRQGFGYEAGKAAIEYANQNIEHNRIFVNIAPDNKPAIALAKKLNLIGNDN